MRRAGTLDHLEVETRAYHAALDRFWLDLVAPDRAIGEADYLQRLVRVYGFEAPLEAALAYTPHLQDLGDVYGHFRSGLIALDLIQLGLTPKQVAGIEQCMIAPFASVPEALGWLYVHERAARVHERVRDALVARLPRLELATAYLAAPSEPGWSELGDTLDRVVRVAAIEDRVVRAALDALHASVQWLQTDPNVARARRA